MNVPDHQLDFRLSRKWLLLASLLLVLPLSACAESPDEQEQQTLDQQKEVINEQQKAISKNDSEPEENKPKFSLNLTQALSHPKSHFTQGLFFWNGNLYESVGLRGKSALIKYSGDVNSISVQRKLEEKYFAEGAAVHNNVIYQLTWTAGKAFAYKGTMLSLSKEDSFEYEGEGWGLTSDGEQLWLSDGTDELRVLNSKGTVLRRVTATYSGQPLDRLNELEWVNGWLLANRWYDNHIFVINPNTGIAEMAFNLAQVANPQLKASNQNVLNGLAWNETTQTLWITGKNWDRFYLAEINLPPL